MPNDVAALKYEAAAEFEAIATKIDRLGSCPPGHDDVGHLKQQIMSHVDKVRAALDGFQTDRGPSSAPVTGEPVPEYPDAQDGELKADSSKTDALEEIATCKTSAEIGHDDENPKDYVVAYDEVVGIARSALGMGQQTGHDPSSNHQTAA